MGRAKQKVALVTGAASGIGAAIAQSFVEDGVRVLLVDIDGERLRDWCSLYEARGLAAEGYQCDVADTASVRSVCSLVLEKHGHVDILVNNAGSSGTEPALAVEDVDEEVWHRVMAVNLTSAFLFCKYLIPGMRETGWGRVLNMSSSLRNGVHGPLNAVAARLPYATAKSALIGFTKQLSKDVARSGITVNALAPGLIHAESDSRITQRFEAMDSHARDRMLSSIPAGRPGTGREVALAVKFLSSDGAAYITGDVLCIDGGV